MFDSDNNPPPPGGNYALGSSGCKKASCQSHTSELSFSPFYQQDSWEQRHRGERRMRIYNPIESWHVPSSVTVRAIIFSDVT